MALKKSQLYSSLWSSCDELRGGMDASQYKDYVLVMLFVKYISDKFANEPYAAITVPEGASFNDMVALKGKPTIGDDINKKIIGPIAEANKLSDMPDFNDVNKLGSGKDMVDRLTNLIAIFENKALDFSKNRAEGDDILGDAYEYLMRHFATESGKSKGQFYTPAEVSRVMAKIVGINSSNSSTSTTVYDPTCGSGSLLLKVANEADKNISLYGQEKDSATSGLARMNMILHNNTLSEIKQGNTLANPLFTDENTGLKTFDYVVANPPFSDKRWRNGINIESDLYERFKDYGVPPAKNGDYAYLLHIVRSLKSGKGKGACILPHGVLFRGNAEAEIRKNLVRKGYIRGIIGLPANLFYGTGIPACIIVLDKEHATSRKGIFMIDASKGFMKDGNKNRLRNMDIHKIVDVFNKQTKVEKYSRMVSFNEIEKNEYNLNIPRYIDSQEAEDIQDIEAHLLGDIPNTDIEALNDYWEAFPTLEQSLFGKCLRDRYSTLIVNKDEIEQTIFEHSEFKGFTKEMNIILSEWKKRSINYLKRLNIAVNPKLVIFELSEELLETYADKALISKYDVYQHLMDYWDDVMQDDCYIISADGWKADTYRIQVENKQKKLVDKGWACDLIPKELVINRYFFKEKQEIEVMEAEGEFLSAQLTEMEEEHGGDEGYFAELEKVNKGNVKSRLKEIIDDQNSKEEIEVLEAYLEIIEKQSMIYKNIKDSSVKLDSKLYAKYPTFSVDEIKTLVVNDKWMTTIEQKINTEIERISQLLALRIVELSERYETPLPIYLEEAKVLEMNVNTHLERMGYVWG
ncbi:type I restriction-modification system subunit M [Paenibacillus agaridevorans]|uniref:site-specific DNA-methyltransferase (adenine-specific) n=1 Tax=Paenibacillus agaridevorans TaxID=171404 RepID=A0A2R5ELS0_9BACL|nr:type I restriction-modification system subunit M [Paenibacillus agaridevorans]GBG05908.1 type I restriction-modification system subunit M [Paenibacillus agaridevorans]